MAEACWVRQVSRRCLGLENGECRQTLVLLPGLLWLSPYLGLLWYAFSAVPFHFSQGVLLAHCNYRLLLRYTKAKEIPEPKKPHFENPLPKLVIKWLFGKIELRSVVWMYAGIIPVFLWTAITSSQGWRELPEEPKLLSMCSSNCLNYPVTQSSVARMQNMSYRSCCLQYTLTLD